MSFKDLSKLLNPASVAIVGASPKGGQGLNPLINLKALGYSGAVYPVNPNYEEIQGYKCYPSLEAIKDTVDTVFLAISNKYILEMAHQAISLGIKSLVILAGGFGETGLEGKRLEAELTKTCLDNDVAVCGPNGLGYLNFKNNVALWGASLPAEVKQGNIGAFFQSGSAAISLLNSGRNLGFSYVVSSGNESVVNGADYINYFIEDPKTTVIAGLIEGVKEPEKMLRAFDKAGSVGKPVLLLKPGSSEKAQQAIASHTGSLAGSSKVFEAVCRQKGVVLIDTIDEFIEGCILFSKIKTSQFTGSVNVGITSPSGGEIAIINDCADEIGLELPDLSEGTKVKLKEILPSFGRPSNPLDITGSGVYQPQLFESLIKALSSDKNIDLIVTAQDAPWGMGSVQAKRYQKLAKTVVKVSQDISKPVIFLSNISGMDWDIAKILAENNVPVLQGTKEGLKAIKLLENYVKRPHQEIKLNHRFRNIIKFAEFDVQNKVLQEHICKKIFDTYGIPSPQNFLAKTTKEAVAFAEELGYPVVMKVCASGLAHKTEIGGVKLAIENQESVVKAFEDLTENFCKNIQNFKLEGILVEKMVNGGMEFILGVSTDPQFGPVVMVGLGGIFVEIIGDVSLGKPPIDERIATGMIESLKAGKLFGGFRNLPQLDKGALVQAIVNISELAVDYQDQIAEIDINPLKVFPEGEGIQALDALIKLK